MEDTLLLSFQEVLFKNRKVAQVWWKFWTKERSASWSLRIGAEKILSPGPRSLEKKELIQTLKALNLGRRRFFAAAPPSTQVLGSSEKPLCEKGN